MSPRAAIVAGLLALAVPFGSPAAGDRPLTVLVLPFDFIDASLQGDLEHGPQPADVARAAHATRQARQLIDGLPMFRAAPPDAGQAALTAAQDDYRFLHRCNGCERTIGRAAGADLVLVGWAQKVSNLILNVNAVLRDVATGRDLAGASVDLRGDTDESWRRAVGRLVNDDLRRSYRATRRQQAGD